MNNGEPFKLQILHALTDAIKSITPNNGYTFDLSDFEAADGVTQARVFRGRAWFGDTDPIPMVSVLEPIEDADYLFSTPDDDTSGAYDWPLLIQGFVSDDPANPTDPAYRLMRDVRRRLIREKIRKVSTGGMNGTDPFGSRDFGLDGCRVTNLKIGTGKVRPADDVSSKAYFWLVVTPTITEDAEEA